MTFFVVFFEMEKIPPPQASLVRMLFDFHFSDVLYMGKSNE
jgi:hypothetical protein